MGARVKSGNILNPTWIIPRKQVAMDNVSEHVIDPSSTLTKHGGQLVLYKSQGLASHFYVNIRSHKALGGQHDPKVT